jgi:HNH endonuclease
MPNCIYCNAANATSISHIIPESLGNKNTLSQGVCGNCNSTFNRQVEEPIVKALSPIRSFLQLRGKRSELPRVRIEVKYGTGSQMVTAKSSADLLRKAFVFKNFIDPQGIARNIAFISFSKDAIEQHTRTYRERNPNIKLNDIPGIDAEDLEFWAQFDFDVFADSLCLRMIKNCLRVVVQGKKSGTSECR